MISPVVVTYAFGGGQVGIGRMELQQVVRYLTGHRVLRQVLPRLGPHRDLLLVQVLQRDDAQQGVVA